MLQHALLMVPVEYLETKDTLSWKPQKPALIWGLSQSLLRSRGTFTWAPGEGKASVRVPQMWPIWYLSATLDDQILLFTAALFQGLQGTKAMSSPSQPFCDSQMRNTSMLPSCHLNADWCRNQPSALKAADCARVEELPLLLFKFRENSAVQGN